MSENKEPTLRNADTRRLVIDLLEASRAAIRVIAETTPFVDDDDPYLGAIFAQVSQRKDQTRAMLRYVARRSEQWLIQYGKPEDQSEPNTLPASLDLTEKV